MNNSEITCKRKEKDSNKKIKHLSVRKSQLSREFASINDCHA